MEVPLKKKFISFIAIIAGSENKYIKTIKYPVMEWFEIKYIIAKIIKQF